jgi:phosphoribosyl-AMP cyclohydrolase
MTLDFSKLDGLLPAVIQEAKTGRVLMLGFMNAEAFQLTLETGLVTFYSRSRQKLWTKGETSGHFLVVREIATDCDYDSILIQAEMSGPGVCHEGYKSCFHWAQKNGEWSENEAPVFNPSTVYEKK